MRDQRLEQLAPVSRAAEQVDRVLGVWMIASVAGTMIAQAAQAMEFGATSEDIAYTCHAHPTRDVRRCCRTGARAGPPTIRASRSAKASSWILRFQMQLRSLDTALHCGQAGPREGGDLSHAAYPTHVQDPNRIRSSSCGRTVRKEYVDIRDCL